MRKIRFRKIILYIFGGINGIVVCLLMIPAGILIFIIDILCQMINEIIKWEKNKISFSDSEEN
ncbi:MAG: hypothetical protein K1W19_15410 [Lachnospiraceae bacterium]|jgi:hypothetical protein|nr:hypothetical protein [Lachnospiraceae bacterium]MCI8824915.1 hypothetical protein [Lachnospiraceae bacterium]MCI9369194.1 hypothetical protein [Lachnospiraceae bacterium]